MFDSARFFLFLTAALLLAIAPGPGILSALGTFLGGMVHVLAAALESRSSWPSPRWLSRLSGMWEQHICAFSGCE